MKLYEILWNDGNGPEWEYTDFWYTYWYKPHACAVCSDLDLRSNTEIEFAAKSIVQTNNIIDVVAKTTSLAIICTDLYYAIQEPFDRSFYKGPVIVNGKSDPPHVACVAKYESRVLFEGSVATEEFSACRGCGRKFQNIIGRRFVQNAKLPDLDVMSSCSGISLIINENVLRMIPSHILERCHVREIPVMT